MKKSTGLFIAELRKEKALTQKQLAEILGVSDKTISHWEREESSPDISLLTEIANFFEITADELLAGEKKPEKNCEKDIGLAIENSWHSSEGTIRLLAEKYLHEFTNKNILCAAVSILALICGFIVLFLEGGYYDIAAVVLLLILTVNLCTAFVFRGNFARIVQIAEIKDDVCNSLRMRANRITSLSCYLILLVSAFAFYFWMNISAALVILAADGCIIFLCELFLRKKGILTPKGYSKKVKMIALLNIITVPLVGLIIFGGLLFHSNFNERYILEKNADVIEFANIEDFKAYMEKEAPVPENTEKLDALYKNTSFVLRQEHEDDNYGFLWYKNSDGETNSAAFLWNNNEVCKIISHSELPIKVYTYSALLKAKSENISLINSLNYIYIAYYLITLLITVFVYFALFKKILKRYKTT